MSVHVGKYVRTVEGKIVLIVAYCNDKGDRYQILDLTTGERGDVSAWYLNTVFDDTNTNAWPWDPDLEDA